MMQLPLPLGSVPGAAVLAGLRLERQNLAHNEADHRAVMACREHLRQWSGDPWPADDFSLDDNRDDLAAHIAEAEAGFAYGYTVFGREADGAEVQGSVYSEVQGSVYFYPAAFFAGRYRLAPDERAALDAAPVAIDYWLRPALEASAGHEDFVRALLHWARTGWGFERAVFMSRPAMQARRALLARLGAAPTLQAESLHTPGWWQSFQVLPAD